MTKTAVYYCSKRQTAVTHSSLFGHFRSLIPFKLIHHQRYLIYDGDPTQRTKALHFLPEFLHLDCFSHLRATQDTLSEAQDHALNLVYSASTEEELTTSWENLVETSPPQKILKARERIENLSSYKLEQYGFPFDPIQSGIYSFLFFFIFTFLIFLRVLETKKSPC